MRLQESQLLYIFMVKWAELVDKIKDFTNFNLCGLQHVQIHGTKLVENLKSVIYNINV